MAQLLSSWSMGVQSVPNDYVLPPEKRPGDVTIVGKDIPVIDLQNNRSEVVPQILKACKEFGLFQVINHGVPEKMMTDIMALCNEFFSNRTEGKPGVYLEDYGKGSMLYTGGIFYDKEEVHMWKDTLHHECYPIEEYVSSWPDKPARYREEMGKYVIEVRNLALKILDLIAEGLGLNAGYFHGALVQEQTTSINHYPPCPDPSLAMGLASHTDPGLITLLQQEQYGLQMEKDGKWIGVEPIPNAFVVNLGYLFQFITNGMLKGAEHRAVTNSSVARTSIGMFLAPKQDLPVDVQPVKELDSPGNPILFKPCRYNDFLAHYYAFMAKPTPRNGTVLDAYRL